MKHLTLPRFWRHYDRLPKEIQEVADKNFQLLKADHFIHPCTLRRLDQRGNFGRCVSALIIGHWAEPNQ